MSAWRNLSDSFDEFQGIQAEIVRNSEAGDVEWRRRLVDLRRGLQDSLVGMRTAVQRCEAEGSDAGICREFASALSTMRSVLALHQARWPAVAIEPSDPAYRQSTQDLRRAGSVFREIARGLIDKLKI